MCVFNIQNFFKIANYHTLNKFIISQLAIFKLVIGFRIQKSIYSANLLQGLPPILLKADSFAYLFFLYSLTSKYVYAPPTPVFNPSCGFVFIWGNWQLEEFLY